MGWHELENGDLLAVAEAAGFSVMVTGDKNISYQQNLANRKLALVVLRTVDWSVLKETSVEVVAAVDRAGLGSFEQM